jgi:hypothetical protein
MDYNPLIIIRIHVSVCVISRERMGGREKKEGRKGRQGVVEQGKKKGRKERKGRRECSI